MEQRRGRIYHEGKKIWAIICRGPSREYGPKEIAPGEHVSIIYLVNSHGATISRYESRYNKKKPRDQQDIENAREILTIYGHTPARPPQPQQLKLF